MNDTNEPNDPPQAPAKPPRSHKAKPPEGTLPILAPGNPPGVVTVGTIPPCPEADPAFGDKTPAVIAWWFKYHPGEAATKYAGRKFQLPASHE